MTGDFACCVDILQIQMFSELNYLFSRKTITSTHKTWMDEHQTPVLYTLSMENKNYAYVRL